MNGLNEAAVYEGLNAPFGARCFLTLEAAPIRGVARATRLNARFGARCFLTTDRLRSADLRP